MRALDLPITFHFFKEKGGWVSCESNDLSSADATKFLRFFIDNFLRSPEHPFLFFPEWAKPNVALYFKDGVESFVSQLSDEVKKSSDKYKVIAGKSGYFSGEYYNEMKEHVDYVYPLLKDINANFFTQPKT